MDELKLKMSGSIDNQADIIIQKMEQFLENLHERKSDIILLKKIVNRLRDPYGLPYNLVSGVHQHSKCNNLEYIE